VRGGKQCAGEHGGHETDQQAIRQAGCYHRRLRGHEHHAFDADIHDARAFADHAAQCGQSDRCGAHHRTAQDADQIK